MKEFIFLIKNTPGHTASMSPIRHNEFLKACEKYIEVLKKDGHLKNAQPMHGEAVLVSKNKRDWNSESMQNESDVIVGYYHVVARDKEEAIEIAKKNPEFSFTNSAKVEIRELKTMEPSTGYEYSS